MSDPLAGMRPSAAGAELNRPEDLVTGEAVVLELRPASFATRALAVAVDLLVQGALLILLFWVTGVVLTGVDAAASSALSLTLLVGVLVGYPVSLETLTRGRSLGKLAFGLRVVRDDGGPIRFRHALVRGMLGVFEFWLTAGCVALITSLANTRGKRLGDLLAGSYVVRDRAPRQLPPPPLMPPYLAAWAGGIDLGRIPDRLAVAIRQFLARADRLHPSSRQRLGTELAEQVAQYVAPAPPPGTPPEVFLAAVLAERRGRAAARLARQAQRRTSREAGRRTAAPLSPVSNALIGEDQHR